MLAQNCKLVCVSMAAYFGTRYSVTCLPTLPGRNIHGAGMVTTQHIFHQLNVFLKDVLNESDVLQHIYVFISFQDRTRKSLTNTV